MLQYIQNQWRKGRKIYGKRSWRETRRTFLHTMRSIRNKREIEDLENYFASYTPDSVLLDRQVGLYELMTRYFLFKNSTPQERLEAIINHFDYLKAVFTDEAIREMYSVDPDNIYDDVSRMKRGFIIWESGKPGVYHANFRFGKGFNGEPAMWIGTVQGYKDGLDNAKTVTKKMFGYRPKNFIMFLLRHIAVICKVESIYAVSDEGFYANTHLVRGHRAKVAELDSLWEESGGVVCSDERFFKIPLEEYRKPIEEIKSQKRSQYRKRYDLLDQYEQEIQDHMKHLIK